MREKLKSLLPDFIVSYFTTGADRSKKAKKNILFSFIIKGLSILISLLLVPLTIDYVNPTKYGIWLTLSSIIGWFTFFDIGFGNGFRNRFAEAVAKKQFKLAKIYVSTTYAILSSIIGVVLILFLVINPFLNWSSILNTQQEMAQELNTLALIVFVFFCLQFVLKLLTTVMTANQQPAKATLINFYGNAGALILIFILTKLTSGNLVYLGFALSIVPFLVLLGTSFWFYKHEYKIFAPELRYVNFRFTKNLMGLGLRFFVIQISGIILFSTDNIIISQIFGPQEVTPYNLAFKYFSIVTIVFSIITTPFWSAFTDAYTKNDFQWIKKSISKMLKVSGIFIAVIIVMVFFSKEFYYLWVGRAIDVPIQLSLFMGFYFVLMLLLQPFNYFINGTGKIQLQLIQSVVAALVNIPLAFYLAKIPALGISGIVLSTVICTAPGLVFSIIQYKRIINSKARGVWNC